MNGDGFVIIPNSVSGDLRLSDGAIRLWIAIAKHCIGKDRCWPSQERLAAMIGKKERHIRNLLKELEDRGHVAIVRTSGQTRGYEISRPGNLLPEPGTPLPTPGNELPPTRQKTVETPGNFLSDTRQPFATELDSRSTIREIDKSVHTPTKKSKKSPPPSREELELQLKKLEGNISQYVSDFPNKNVRETLDALRDYVLLGDGINDKPNPKGYKDLNLTLRKWLRNAKNVPSWVAAQNSFTPPPMVGPAPSARKSIEDNPNDPEYFKYLANIKEKRDAKIAAREKENQERKAKLMEELKEGVQVVEPKPEEKQTLVIEAPKRVTSTMTKEQIKEEMRRIANGGSV